jgi:hypothetical protein
MPPLQQGELLAEHKVFQEKIPTAEKEAKECVEPGQNRLSMGQSYNRLRSEPGLYIADSSTRKHFGE